MELARVNALDGAPTVRTAADILRHVKLIEEVSRAVMKDGVHFGKVPGCGDKPTLLKPGAEKLLMTFALATKERVRMTSSADGHREYEVTTEVWSGERLLAEGVGVCSTRESKYRYRKADRKCPKCGKEGSVIKGKEEYGGGWLCWKKKGGCDAKFKDGDESIEKQQTEKVDNPDIADTYNTVLKMAKKRSLVDGALTATGASDFFAQDLEELDAKDAQFVVKEEAQAARSQARKVAPETPPASEAGRVMDEIVNMPHSLGRLTAETVDAPQGNVAAPVGRNGLLSFSGASHDKWHKATEEQRSQAGDVSRKQCKLITDLVVAKAKKDGEAIDTAGAAKWAADRLREDFEREFDEHGIEELWQISKAMATHAIDELKEDTQ